MEYCSGQSLESYLSKRNSENWNMDECRQDNFNIFTNIINGIVEVHKNNVIHRDLKPENIFIDFNEHTQLKTAKIGDFGLARMLTSNNQEQSPIRKKEQNSSKESTSAGTKSLTTISRFSSVAGTEIYMAPEIKKHFLKGTKPEKFSDIEINKKTDIFQLGLILYEICHPIKTGM
jgi:serine/threonine protein kinase